MFLYSHTYFWISDGIIALSITEHLIKSEFFYFLLGASIFGENLLWYLQELVEITHYVEFLFYFIYVLADFHFHICSLVWMYAFMYLSWLFCLREVSYVYHNSVMSLALWIYRMRKNCLITTVTFCTWNHVLRKEDNYYFAQSKYKKFLEETLTQNPNFFQPSFWLNEVRW